MDWNRGLQTAHAHDVLPGGGVGADPRAGKLALALGSPSTQKVTLARAFAEELAGSGDLEPLREAAVRLVLGSHVFPIPSGVPCRSTRVVDAAAGRWMLAELFRSEQK